MRCPQCEAEVLDQDRFCYACGADLSVRPPAAGPAARTSAARPVLSCRQCGKALDPADRFCGYCGAEVSFSGMARPPDSATPSAVPASGRQTTPLAPQASRSHWVAALLAYLNILISLGVLGFGYILLQSPAYSGSYYPFLVARYAIVSLLTGMLVFGIYLWTRKTRRDRRQARIIVFISLVAIVVGVLLFA